MSKQRKQPPEVSIFANNPFLEELLALRDSPEDEQLIEVSDTLWDLLEDVQLDASNANLSGLMQNDLISKSLFSASRNSIRTSPVTRSRSFWSTGLIWATLRNTTPRLNWTSSTG